VIRAAGFGVAAAPALALWLLAATPVAAQDGFGGGTSSPRAATRAAPATSPTDPVVPAGASGEAQDFGVPATSRLRPSDQLGGPTPTSIPGGRVITTQALAGALRAGQGQVLLLHAYASPQHLPGAVAVVPAAQGGQFDDDVQRGFGQYLRQATGGDTSRMLVVYCGGPQCWGSYNAALRAIQLGYRNVHWYRGGLQAWQQAGLPVGDASSQAASQVPPPAPTR